MKRNLDEVVVGFKNNRECDRALKLPIVNVAGSLIGVLRLIDQSLAESTRLVESLTKWRNLSKKGFFTQFEATNERTAKWLNEVILPSAERLMFEVIDVSGNSLGQAGLCSISEREAELDNFIRGEIGGDRALFLRAEIALLNWVFFYLDIPKVKLWIFSTNLVPLKNHISLGFQIVEERGLVTVKEDGILRHSMDTTRGTSVAYKYLKMELNRSEFIK
jgi:hypothetical protein